MGSTKKSLNDTHACQNLKTLNSCYVPPKLTELLRNEGCYNTSQQGAYAYLSEMTKKIVRIVREVIED